jgi:hypothetical protein
MTAQAAPTGAGLLVLLAAMPQERLQGVLANLAASFPAEGLLVASPDALPPDSYPTLRFVAAPATSTSWTLHAADFVNAYQLAEQNGARAVLMLGPESGSLDLSALHSLAYAVLATEAELAVSCYDLPLYAGLVNSAILYPLTRALFASPVRYPLAPDICLSLRMAERLAGAAHRFTAIGEGEAPLWPVNEAMVAGFTIDQFDVGPRLQHQPTGPDLNIILPLLTGSLFSDIDAKAAFWQRFRPLPPVRNVVPMPRVPATGAAADIAPMLQAFGLAYANLQEIWSLVLPPSSLLGLKRLAATDGEAFRMPDNLWARIVYDFLLAYRLRTINRGHLLGALIPLYLAWVASHINLTAASADTESHIEAVAAAFEAEKTYMVSRWRWPDRFNP